MKTSVKTDKNRRFFSVRRKNNINNKKVAKYKIFHISHKPDAEKISAIKKQNAFERKKRRDAEREKKQSIRLRVAAERAKRRNKLFSAIAEKFKNRRSGFDYVNYGVVPIVKMSVRGDRASIITRLANSGIVLRDIDYSCGETQFKIQKKDICKAIAILNEMCYTYNIVATYGMVRRLFFLLSRVGLAVGMTIVAVCLNIVYGYVWRIKIVGNCNVSQLLIESALNNAGIAIGCKKSNLLDLRAASILNGIDGIADASCEVVGTTLYVRVLESEKPLRRTLYDSYVSLYDAVVTRIAVRSGTSVVKTGDIVKCGDVLANGNIYSATGELMFSMPCDADVYGNVSLVLKADITSSAVEYRRTGKSAKSTVFTLFGKDIGTAKSPFKSYDMSSHTAQYDTFLPLYATTFEYYETVAVEYERNIDELVKVYVADKLEELAFLGDFEYSYNIVSNFAGLYAVHMFVKGETLISRGVQSAGH